MVRILFVSTLYCLTEAMSYCKLILITYRPLFCVCTPFKAIFPSNYLHPLTSNFIWSIKTVGAYEVRNLSGSTIQDGRRY